MKEVIAALSLLMPYDIDKPKVRIGAPNDGGYILVDDFSPDQVVLSYGISTNYVFDRDMAERGHNVYMFDHTIPGINKPSERMHYFKEGVAGQSRPDQNLFSIGDHLQKYEIPGDRLILKMDVEGAEFDALGSAPDSVLSRFEQITFEVHRVASLGHKEYRRPFVRLFGRLNKLFTLCHVHANNNKGHDDFLFVGGVPVSPILELSYVKTSTVNRFPSQTVYPTHLDAPNVWTSRDKVLWMFPFIPTAVASEEFVRCAERLDLQDANRDLRKRINDLERAPKQ
jgi:hypothetical protein